MIDKIKTKLIHWLGGYNKAELRKKCRESYEVGKINMAFELHLFADTIYGLPADEWCKKVYERIKQGYQ